MTTLRDSRNSGHDYFYVTVKKELRNREREQKLGSLVVSRFCFCSFFLFVLLANDAHFDFDPNRHVVDQQKAKRRNKKKNRRITTGQFGQPGHAGIERSTRDSLSQPRLHPLRERFSTICRGSCREWERPP